MGALFRDLCGRWARLRLARPPGQQQTVAPRGLFTVLTGFVLYVLNELAFMVDTRRRALGRFLDGRGGANGSLMIIAESEAATIGRYAEYNMERMQRLADFEGQWQLSRRITDRRNGVKGTLIGVARFLANDDDGGLRYEEEGQLSYAGQAPMAATRSYLWTQNGDAIDVCFGDGRPFHRISLDRLMPDDNHHCDPDFYNVSYDFTDWPLWRAVWRVLGPAKDYRMVSEYRRTPS